MSRLSKRVHIGKYAIPALLLLALAVGTVAATVYVIVSWTTTMTVAAHPRVHFWKWSDGSEANTFDESFNIFPSIKTIDDNATYGIYSVDVGNCSLRISSITNTGNIGTVYIKVFNSTSTLEMTWSTGDTLPQPYTWFITSAGEKYTIYMEATGASGAGVGTSSVVTVDMKVESP